MSASVARKFRFQLIILAILIVFFGNIHLIFAQSASTPQAVQYAEFRIGADNSVVFIPRGSNPRPISGGEPEYPIRAKQRGVTGWNLVVFSVNEEGNVDADSILVVDSKPVDIFDSSSISTIAQLKFRSPSVDEAKVGATWMRVLLRYESGQGTVAAQRSRLINREYLPLNYITPQYPIAARTENVEGYVLVEFTVTKEGVPAGIVILDRSPSNIFNASAINAAERFRFSPRMMDGEPVAAEGARYLFNFKP